MADKNQDQEPSIEEILDSIRQIISEDDEPQTPSGQTSAPGPAIDPVPMDIDFSESPDDPPIELTEKIRDDNRMDQSASADDPFAALPEAPSIDIDMQDAESALPPLPEPEPVIAKPMAPPKQNTASFDTLLTSSAENAAYEGFAELARKTAIQHGGITVEEIVRTELRPLLSDWLDKHLPNIIERLVQEELERVAKRALED